LPSRPSSRCSSHGDVSHGYAQIFRSGAIEGVAILPADDATGVPFLAEPLFEGQIVSAENNYLHFQKSIGIELPIALFVSFCGMRGCHLRVRTELGGGYYQGRPLQEDVVALPDALIESDSVNVPQALRINFHTIWNAFGHMRSNKYNNDGEWIGTVEYKYPGQI
jgi:hypothetical protein